MRVVIMYKDTFAQYDLSGVTSISKAGSTITVAGTVAGNPFSQTFAADAVMIVIVHN